MKRKKGFTLVELLVVISIIALLLSILMPSLSKVRKQAQSVVCMSNLKQWGIITTLYSANNDDRFLMGYNYILDPSAGGLGDDKLAEAMWMLSLEDYYQDTDLRLCPSAKKLTIEGSTFTAWGELPATIYRPSNLDGRLPYGSYAINGWIRSLPRSINTSLLTNVSRQEGENAFWQSTKKLKQPNIVPFYADAGWWDVRPKDNDRIPDPFEHTGGATHWDEAHVGIKRHGNGINLVMGDGAAVSAKPLREMWKYQWSTVFKTKRYYDDAGWANYPWYCR